MKRSDRTGVACFFVLLAFFAMDVRGAIQIPNAPAGEILSDDYQVQVNGRAAPVYTAITNRADLGGRYAFMSFDVTEPARVVIHTKLPLDKLVIRPKSVITPQVKGQTISLAIDRPMKLSIEPTGRAHPLLLFANPSEKGAPKRDDPNVIYFGPGVHHPKDGKIELESGQRLYLAAGAVVHAAVRADHADHIRIDGRGILDGSDWPWLKGPFGQLLALDHCHDVEIEGITLRSSFAWTLLPLDCDNVRITNVKILNDRVQNDDGINPSNSSNVTIDDCFIRTDDDCIALKGIDASHAPVKNITVRNTLLWCDRARIFLMGHESQASEMSDILIEDCHILHDSMTAFLLEPGEEMPLKNVRIENVTVNAEGKADLTRIHPTINQYMKKQSPGHVSNVVFDNVSVEGASGPGIDVSGFDAKHRVDGVSFDHVTINGQLLKTRDLKIGPFTDSIKVSDQSVQP